MVIQQRARVRRVQSPSHSPSLSGLQCIQYCPADELIDTALLRYSGDGRMNAEYAVPHKDRHSRTVMRRNIG